MRKSLDNVIVKFILYYILTLKFNLSRILVVPKIGYCTENRVINESNRIECIIVKFILYRRFATHPKYVFRFDSLCL